MRLDEADRSSRHVYKWREGKATDQAVLFPPVVYGSLSVYLKTERKLAGIGVENSIRSWVIGWVKQST